MSRADGNGVVGALTRLVAMPNDSTPKIVLVAVSLCLVCSVMVSSAAVLLRPYQERNEQLAMKREILKVAGLYEPGGDIETLFGQVETRIVELRSGEYRDDIDPDRFSYEDAARDPATRVTIADESDIAGIGARAAQAPVYLLREDDRLQYVILPVQGQGLWSRMHGFVSLEGDGTTVAGITFYRHAETPGLGAEIDNPAWQSKWQGKRVHDADGDVRLRVIKGSVDARSPDAAYQIDGLSGATLTANGVTNLVHYWLGEQGFGPYLAKLRSWRGAEL